MTRWSLLPLAVAILCSCTPAGAVPVEETAYGKSGLRLEMRPDPKWMSQQGPFARTEGAQADAGVSARWLSVVDPLGAPYYPSAALPTDVKGAAENDALFRDWVAALHARGLPVVSWYPLIISRSAVTTHPEWRQRFLVPEPEGHCKGNTPCIHTGYGQALIDFCNEAIDRYGLDGFWFDGSAWTQIWDRPLPLSCACDSCRVEFRKATGLNLPERVDWSSPAFRGWVAWRYDAFGAYIGRLARGIRSRHPNAAVVVNHYHRPSIPWQGAIPLNPYDADIITGSEASGPERVDLTMRLCMAYGRKQSEVWRPFEVGGDREMDDLVHHALACITAGGMPSYGGGLLSTPQAVAAAKAVSGVIDALRPTVGGEPVKDVALHLSQQAETFHFSRAPKGVGWDLEPYWASIETWTDALGRMHRPPTYLFDRSLTARSLAGYRVLLLPMSQALSDAQARAVVDFVRSGGTVVLGVGSGQLDEWGEPRARNPLGKALGFTMEGVPSPAADEGRAVTLAGENRKLSLQALRTPVRLVGREWKVLYRHDADGRPAVAECPYGKGSVVVTDCEPAGIAGRWQPVAGGDTRIAVTEGKARQGKRSLELTDSPNAPYPFCPDIEMNFPGFGLPRFPRGRFSCDLWAGRGAETNIELRWRAGQEVRLGPSLSIAGRKVSTHAGVLGDVPVEKWIRVEIAFRFGESGAVYDLALTGEGGFRRVYSGLPCIHPDFRACNWAVLYGGKESATFRIDDLRVERLDGAGDPQVVLADDFEATPIGGVTPERRAPEFIRALMGVVARHAPPVVAVDAPESVRVGAFRQGDRVVVHLHNRAAGHRDWKQASGPPVTLRLALPVKHARSLVSGEALPIRREQGRSAITLPHVGLHETIMLD